MDPKSTLVEALTQARDNSASFTPAEFVALTNCLFVFELEKLRIEVKKERKREALSKRRNK